MVSELIPEEEKRQALDRVLASRTFSRSDQLRNFLRYVCEAEFEGRGQGLNEYVLGVSVLGRPSDYSPAEDSCVRSRAYELRNKLKTYYRLEAPSDPLQIDIRKGAYIPQFQRAAETKPLEIAISPSALEASALIPAPPEAPYTPARRGVPARPRIAVTLVALLAGALGLYFYSTRQKTATTAPAGQ